MSLHVSCIEPSDAPPKATTMTSKGIEESHHLPFYSFCVLCLPQKRPVHLPLAWPFVWLGRMPVTRLDEPNLRNGQGSSLPLSWRGAGGKGQEGLSGATSLSSSHVCLNTRETSGSVVLVRRSAEGCLESCTVVGTHRYVDISPLPFTSTPPVGSHCSCGRSA